VSSLLRNVTKTIVSIASFPRWPRLTSATVYQDQHMISMRSRSIVMNIYDKAARYQRRPELEPYIVSTGPVNVRILTSSVMLWRHRSTTGPVLLYMDRYTDSQSTEFRLSITDMVLCLLSTTTRLISKFFVYRLEPWTPKYTYCWNKLYVRVDCMHVRCIALTGARHSWFHC
jgi:hypothetical protein